MKSPRYPFESLRIVKPAIPALALLASFTAAAAELPSFRQGMWEFHRTITGPGGNARAVNSTQCTDPSADMKRMNDMLAKQGCSFSGVSAQGNVYSFSSECRIMGITSSSATSITAESDSAYTVTVKGTTDGEVTEEVLTARRLGDC